MKTISIALFVGTLCVVTAGCGGSANKQPLTPDELKDIIPPIKEVDPLKGPSDTADDPGDPKGLGSPP